jgi:hypothetical protein
MGWKLRRGKSVYYRKVREAGHVRSVYCGAGERGEAAAREVRPGALAWKPHAIRETPCQSAEQKHVKSGSCRQQAMLNGRCQAARRRGAVLKLDELGRKKKRCSRDGREMMTLVTL